MGSADSESSLLLLIGVVVFAFLIFLAIRAVMLWYWKIDVIVKQLMLLNENVKKLVEVSGKAPAQLKQIDIDTEEEDKK